MAERIPKLFDDLYASDSASTEKVPVVQSGVFSRYVSLASITNTGVIDHETLDNLQGGTDGQHNHLTDAQLADLGKQIHVGTSPPSDTTLLWLDTN